MGSAEYYNGFAPDKLTPDGVNKNWGDVTEASLASALHYIKTGLFESRTSIDEQNKRMLTAQKQYQPLNSVMYGKKFTGMFVEKRQ